MSGPTHKLAATEKQRLEAACERAAAARLPQLPLFRSAADGLLAFGIIADPAVIWPIRLNQTQSPYLILLGDDPFPNGFSHGPSAWKCASAAKQWAKFAIIHGTGPALEHYRIASLVTVLHRRVVLVETDSAHVEEWAKFFDCPVMRFVPPTGCVHPSPVADVMQ